MPKCPNCDTVVEKNASACPSCGARFRQKPPASEDVPEELEDFEDDDDDRPTRSSKATRAKQGRKSNSSSSVILIVLATVGVVSVCFCIPILIALLLPAVQQAREAARSTQAMNHMKQIGLAAHNFHDTFNQFPPSGVARPERQPQLAPNTVPQAFMTDILPFVDQAPLYNMVQRGQVWSDPLNKAAFSNVVPTYLHPSVPGQPVNAEGYAVAHYATNGKAISDQATVGIADITDGTSNTMMLGTVNDGFKAWGDPTNHRDPSSGFNGGPMSFGASNNRTAIILLFDGSVRRVPVTLSPDICSKIADYQDGQPVGEF